MNKTGLSLAAKFGLTLGAAAIAFSLIDRKPLGRTLAAAAAGTAFNYLLGDLVLLPRLGNAGASVADGLSASGTAMAINRFFPKPRPSGRSLLAFGSLVALGEAAFHRYLQRTPEVAP